MRRFPVLLGCWIAVPALIVPSMAQGLFGIKVVDSQTGRGVPLVKIGANNQDYYTDSNGLVAIGSPDALNQNIAVSTDFLWLRRAAPCRCKRRQYAWLR